MVGWGVGVQSWGVGAWGVGCTLPLGAVLVLLTASRRPALLADPLPPPPSPSRLRRPRGRGDLDRRAPQAGAAPRAGLPGARGGGRVRSAGVSGWWVVWCLFGFPLFAGRNLPGLHRWLPCDAPPRLHPTFAVGVPLDCLLGGGSRSCESPRNSLTRRPAHCPRSTSCARRPRTLWRGARGSRSWTAAPASRRCQRWAGVRE